MKVLTLRMSEAEAADLIKLMEETGIKTGTQAIYHAIREYVSLKEENRSLRKRLIEAGQVADQATQTLRNIRHTFKSIIE